MAPATARAVRDATGRVLLYTPVVAPADFDHALAYLFRRLEENAGGENFIAAVWDPHDEEAFARRARPLRRPRWRSATRFGPPPVDIAWPVRPAGGAAGRRFANEPDTDPTDPVARRRLTEALGAAPDQRVPGELDEAGIDRVVRTAAAGAARWAAVPAGERAAVLDRCAEELAARRPDIGRTDGPRGGQDAGRGGHRGLGGGRLRPLLRRRRRGSWTGSTEPRRSHWAPSP